MGGLFEGRDLASAERYDPRTETWIPAGHLQIARRSHQAVRLLDGQVPVAGGVAGFQFLDSAELYDPAEGTWRATAPMRTPPGLFQMVALAEGSVLAVREGPPGAPTAERYDPATHSWEYTAAPESFYQVLSLTLLASGEVLALGLDETRTRLAAARYDPSTVRWTPAAPPVVERLPFFSVTLRGYGCDLVVLQDPGWPELPAARASGQWSPKVTMQTKEDGA